MSEEKRFTNKKLIAVSIILVLVSGMTGVLGFVLVGVLNNNTTLSGNYDELYIDYLELSSDFNELDNQYFILTGEHIELENDYNVLVIALADMTDERDALDSDLNAMILERDNLTIALANMTAKRDDLLNQIEVLDSEILVHLGTIADLNSTIIELEADILALEGDYDILSDAYNDLDATYSTLLIAYDYICNTIKQSILPVQYCIFAEAVRRYYMPIYLGGKEYNTSEHREASVKFCRDMILHDSGQYNAFTEVSNAFSDALIFGNDTMSLAFHIMYEEFWPWLYNWDGWGLTGNNITDINTIVDWCIEEIDYEYDWIITYNQESFDYDYIKFPVETAFRTMGDCDDQMILTAAYLESCGFETTIILIRDSDYLDLYHYSLFVNVMDMSFYGTYPDCPLWFFYENDPYYPYVSWCWVDTTWDVPFGSIPAWLQYYMDYNIINLYSFANSYSFAICDIDGYVGSTFIGGGL